MINAVADGSKGKWTVAEGLRTIYVGRASNDLLLSKNVAVRNYANNTDKAIKAAYSVAYYDAAGRLVTSATENITIGAGESKLLTVSSDYATAAKASVFLWDADTFIPLIESFTQSIVK